MKITEEQIERAKSVNLPHFLISNGFELKKSGREYVLSEHDSLHIKDNSFGEHGKWYRFSTHEGGDNIGFVRQFMGKSFVEAVELLNGEHYNREFVPFQSYKQHKPEKTDISISEHTDGKRVLGYLCNTRGLDYKLISDLVRSGKLVQEQNTGNAVFKIFDENNKLVGAEKVGTSTAHKFKGIATGSASGYGFEIRKGKGENALFFESAVDMLSYLQMHGSELDNHRLVSMMGVKPTIVIETMERHGILPENVFICSDNDKAGNEFAEKITEKYPQMQRIIPESRYKDWNDMLRDIPIAEKAKENSKMKTYGNKIWNDATDNRDKSLVSMTENDFLKLKEQLDSSGINYYAYSKDGKAVMAVNDKDVDWLKKITNTNDLPTHKSNVEHIPPNKNIIGNVEYRYISDKQYISADSDTILKMADIMQSRNVQFSGRVYPNGKATLTVSGADLPHVKAIQQNIIDARKPFVKETKADEIIGNKAYHDIRQRQFYHSKLTPEEYNEIKPYLDTEAQYSGLIRNNKIVFTVEKEDSAAFHRALENARREVGIIHALKDNGIDDYRLEKLSAVIHRFAVEDIHESLDSFFTPQLNEQQFDKMLSLLNDYLAQSVSERYGEYSGLDAILDFKNEIDKTAELDEFFSEHSFSDEQKTVITEMFMQDSSKTNIEVIDETFTPDDIREYYNILHNQLETNEVTDFLNSRKQKDLGETEPAVKDSIDSHFEESNAIVDEHEKTNETPELTEKEQAFLNGDLVSFMAKAALAYDEIESIGFHMYEDGYNDRIPPNSISSFGSGLKETALHDLVHRMQNGEDIRKEMARALIDKHGIFFDDDFEKITAEYDDNGAAVHYGNVERRVSYEDLGDEFFKLFRKEHDEIVHDRTVEDLTDVIPDLNDETAEKLIEAFDKSTLAGWNDEKLTNNAKINRIKKSLYDILGDEEKTEKAFASIADMKYNYKAETMQTSKFSDTITMRKIGTTYEIFGENAKIAADILDMELISKNGNDIISFSEDDKDKYVLKLEIKGYTVLTDEYPKMR